MVMAGESCRIPTSKSSTEDKQELQEFLMLKNLKYLCFTVTRTVEW